MIVIIPPHARRRGQPPASPHDQTVGMFVVFVILLCITLFVLIVGPHTNSPPPAAVSYALAGCTLIIGFLAFFFWRREQGEGDDADRTHPDVES